MLINWSLFIVIDTYLPNTPVAGAINHNDIIDNNFPHEFCSLFTIILVVRTSMDRPSARVISGFIIYTYISYCIPIGDSRYSVYNIQCPSDRRCAMAVTQYNVGIDRKRFAGNNIKYNIIFVYNHRYNNIHIIYT